MKLGEIFPKLDLSLREKNLIISGLSRDLRSLACGDLFFILPGPSFDIFKELPRASQLAAAFIAPYQLKSRLGSLIEAKPLILVKEIDKELRRIADLFYDRSKSRLKIIGVTGTNGKTTTSFLIYHLLKKLNQPVSLFGTLKHHIGDKTYPADYTTPELLSLRRILQKAEASGSKFVVMEVSSHGLAQGRCRGVIFSNCIFTNLSRDHLDYHRTMSNYFRAKKNFFLNNQKAAFVLNIDDPYGKKLFKLPGNKISYGTGPGAAIRGYDLRLGKSYSRFKVSYKQKEYHLKTRLCGQYNLLNIMAALGSVVSLGFSFDQAISNLVSFKPVPGRLELIRSGVFVDYAHTPDALSKVLEALKGIGYQKIICAFGCGGQRDKGKRRLMGRVACQQADFSFITSDNPRWEKPIEICQQIEEGFTKKNYRVIVDRKKAIKESIRLLSAYRNRSDRSSCLLVAGKGHEAYQLIGDRKIAFKDSKIIRSLLKN